MTTPMKASATITLFVFFVLALILGVEAQSPVTTPASTSIAQFTPGASTPLTTTSPSLTGSDAASSIASHSSDGINSGNPSITTTGGGIQGISTGISGGYDTPAQTATTTDAAAGTQGGNSGVLQSGGGANEAAALNRACGASVVTVVVIAVAAVLL